LKKLISFIQTNFKLGDNGKTPLSEAMETRGRQWSPQELLREGKRGVRAHSPIVRPANICKTTFIRGGITATGKRLFQEKAGKKKGRKESGGNEHTTARRSDHGEIVKLKSQETMGKKN